MKKLTGGLLVGAIILGTFAFTASAATKQSTHYTESELKSMDTNKDSMVSKEEFLAYSEIVFGKMKLTNGMISLKNNARSGNSSPSNDSSMNNRSTGTAVDKRTLNGREAVNGKTY